ncbi:phage terminase large subunit family protein [Phenylobacterium sp.]|jgi:hypothetical protein|uniref:phage terminase large subunit family protein n=1 Tax=Phenylobacterium sp. TaxID=1871053 RepID=UPI002F94A92C
MKNRNGQAAASVALAIGAVEGLLTGDVATQRIPAEMSLADWCDSIALDRTDPVTGQRLRGLKVDGQPFSLADRPQMRWIYDQIPKTREEAEGQFLILMKCAQVGFTVMEILSGVYMALKFEPLRVGYFLPDQGLARTKSGDRFMPIIRSIPEAYQALTAADPHALRPVRTEGNLERRKMGGSEFRFLWTTGRSTTESNPMDVLCFDEVQGMTVSAMEKVQERVSGSKMKFVLMGSTAQHPGGDIHAFYLKGSQWRFHTRCPTCGVEEPLDDYFPACIGFDAEAVHPKTGVAGMRRYRCRSGHWISDTQIGTWKPDRPDADPRYKSVHFHQMLSPTVTAEEIYFAYLNADDIQNFWNRKLGKPFQDPNELPVTEAVLAACVAEGEKAGVRWKTAGRNTFMGIDQMGGFNCVVVMERLPDGRHALIHAEEIYSDKPFDRCSDLMEAFGVQVCVVEQLPNVNDARRFARKHEGRVFIVTRYCDIDEGIARWGGGGRPSHSESRTVDEERDRWTVHVDQHKAMSLTLHRMALTATLFPNPVERVQEVREKDATFQAPILKQRIFPHLTSTALVTKRANELERRYRRAVEKRGKDPHFSFAFMLCEVAMVRAFGTATFILPDLAQEHPTSPEQHPIIQQLRHPATEGTCGACVHFHPLDGDAGERGNGVCAALSTGTQKIGVHLSYPATNTCAYEPTSG